MKHSPRVNTTRLFAAADVLLHALDAPPGDISAMVPLYLPDLHPHRKPPSWAFTQSELDEALSFLIRLGLTHRSTDSRSAVGMQGDRAKE